MLSYVVKQPNGKLAVFSTVVDSFTHFNETQTEQEEYWTFHLGEEQAKLKVQRGLEDNLDGMGISLPEKDGLDRWKQALETIYLIHGEAEMNRYLFMGAKV